jgi:hypothetical protein
MSSGTLEMPRNASGGNLRYAVLEIHRVERRQVLLDSTKCPV